MVNDDVAPSPISRAGLARPRRLSRRNSWSTLVVSNAGLSDDERHQVLFHVDHGNVSVAGAVPSEASVERRAARDGVGRRAKRRIDRRRAALRRRAPEMETATQKTLTAIQPVTLDNVNVFSNLTLVCEPRLTMPSAGT